MASAALLGRPAETAVPELATLIARLLTPGQPDVGDLTHSVAAWMFTHMPMSGWMGQTAFMDREGRQELHYRALEDDVPGIRHRLRAGDDVNLPDNQGFTALHFASQQSNFEAIRVLLDAGAAVDLRDRYGNTPLWRAVFNSRGDGEVVAALLEGGADPDAVNNAGVSPRALAEKMAGAERVSALFAEAH